MSDVAPNVYAMDAEYRESLDRSSSATSWYVPDVALLPSCAQQFVICESDREKPVAAFYAFPYRKRSGVLGTRVLRAGRLLTTREGWEGSTVRSLVAGLRRLGRYVGAFMVELEVYRKVRAPIFFPSSPCAIDVCNDPTLSSLLMHVPGVSLDQVSQTFEVVIQDVLPRLCARSNVLVRPIRPGDSDDRATYYRLWSENTLIGVSACSGRADSCLKSRPWYDDVCCWFRRRDYILFAEVDGVPVGFVHWWPNLYKMIGRYGRGCSLTLAGDASELMLKESGEAKIFKMCISRRAGKPRAVAEALIMQALRVMNDVFGVRVCQVSGIRPGDKLFTGPLEYLGSNAVHEVGIFTLAIQAQVPEVSMASNRWHISTQQRLSELIGEVGFPPGVVNLVNGGREVGNW